MEWKGVCILLEQCGQVEAALVWRFLRLAWLANKRKKEKRDVKTKSILC